MEPKTWGKLNDLQSLAISERIFYMRYFHGEMVQGGIKEDNAVSICHM